MTSPGGPAASLPAGVYRGPKVDVTAVEAYEAFLGHPVGWVLAFAADTPASWAQFETATLAASTGGPAGTQTAGDWVPLLGGRNLMLSVPACCFGSTWATEGSGVNDQHWAALARNLATAGLGGCALRIGREFNGGWYRWKVTPANSAAYLTAYPRIVSVMRNAGFTGPFIWNPYIGQGTFGPNAGVENVYPGDGCVDVIGVDLYDGPSPSYPAGEVIRTPAAQQAVWGTFLNQWDGLTGWRNLAVSHGKPLAYPEWGLRLWNDGALYQGGGDNPFFVGEMAAWLLDTGAWMHGFWEDPDRGVADPDGNPGRQVAAPEARLAFLGAFGALR